MSSAWLMVHTFLSAHEAGTFMPFQKGSMPHPRDEGAVPSAGLPVLYAGQVPLADYRFPPAHDGSGLHVKEYPGDWVAHIDQVHPARDFLEHLRVDAPGVYISGGAALGALLGTALGRNWQAALVGAGLGALFAAIVAEAKK